MVDGGRIVIVGISGSPKERGSSTRFLLEQAIDAAAASMPEGIQLEGIVVDLSKHHIEPCTGCDACVRRKPCPLSDKDDMPEIEGILKQADGVIIAAPSYFCSVPGILKNFIDRTRPLKMADHGLKDRFFGAITYAGLKYGGQEAVVDYLNRYALTQGMIVVGGLGSPIRDGIAGMGSMQTDEGKWRTAKSDELAIQSAKILGRRMGELLLRWRFGPREQNE